MNLELPVIDYALVYYATGIAATLVGGVITIWKASSWFTDKFDEVKKDIREWLEKHENQDQARHEQNIQRFAVMETQLKTLINGKH